MRYTLTIVEQLDRAAAELATDHPINNRRALILIDNAAEIILHRQCVGYLERDKEESRIAYLTQQFTGTFSATAPTESPKSQVESSENRPLMTPKHRARAGGKSLPDKLKVLKDMGDLTPAERQFVAIAHDYRNELYHVGLTRDDIIRAVAGHYFRLCCDLFVRMRGQGLFNRMFSSGDEYTDVARRYLPMRSGRLSILDVDDEALADKLRSALPDDIPDLITALAESARRLIGQVNDDFKFLVRGNPFGLDSSEMLQKVQWLQDLGTALEREGVDGLWMDPDYRLKYHRVAGALEQNWVQRHTSDPTEGWKLRASGIGSQTDPLRAVELYQSLRNDMSYLEEAIHSAAGELDRVIEAEVDRVRGK